MGRTKRSAKLDTRTARLKLEVSVNHQDVINPGQYLMYRRPKGGSGGSWTARWRDPETGKIKQLPLGSADDFSDADEIQIFDFAQAQAKAKEWFKDNGRRAVLVADGAILPEGVYTVAHAIAEYFLDAARRGVKGLNRDLDRANAHILPPLGEVEVAKLSRGKIEKWLQAMAESPRRLRTKKGEEQRHAAPPSTDDEKRARKDSANRVLTVLKGALNCALDARRVTSGEAWMTVKPYEDTTSVRIRFLNQGEQVRLVNACPPDFRRLVQAALFTGARCGELGRLRVHDFNRDAGTLFIEFSKNGKSRHIVLTGEAVPWFDAQCAGRGAGETMFLRDDQVFRRTRSLTSTQAWEERDQVRPMHEACEASGVESLTFHELRHTYASGLVNRGVPMAFVAAQIGHTNTRTCEKHYGHLAPSALAASIRLLAPTLGIAEAPVIEALKIQGA